MNSAAAIEVLQATVLPEETCRLLRRHFTVHELPKNEDERNALLEAHGPRIRGIATTGKGPVDAKLIDSLPALEIIACYSAGLDGIDLDAAARRNVRVTNTSAVLAEDVADIALALLLGVTRGIGAADRFVRSGAWQQGAFALGHTLRGLKVGIIGLGHIGKALARRLDVMGAAVAYYGPRRKAEVSYPFFADLVDLARWSRALVVCCPGGAATRHLVDARILEALGPTGWLVNISRGTVVDEAALVDALKRGAIAGAGLDVFENEPHVPAELLDDERVMLLPHIGSATHETRAAMGESMVDALRTHFRLPT